MEHPAKARFPALSHEMPPDPLGFFSPLQPQGAQMSPLLPWAYPAKGSLMFRSKPEAGKSFWAGEPSLLSPPHSVNLQSRGVHQSEVVYQSLRGQVEEEEQEPGGRKGRVSKPDPSKVITCRLALVSGCYDDRQGYAPQRYSSGPKQPLPGDGLGRRTR